MSHKFLSFIETVLNTKSLDLSNLFSLILKSDFTPSEICDYCIDLFVQLNFTGPSDKDVETVVNGSSENMKLVTDELTCEGETPFCKSRGLILLWIAKSVCEKLQETKNPYKSYINYLKCIYLHQATLQDERSPLLKSQMTACFDAALELKANDEEGLVDALDEFQLLMLASHLHMKYYEYDMAQKIFERCQSLLGVSTQLKGALGKRTKFQQDNVSQLYLEVTRQSTPSADLINAMVEKAASRNLPNDKMIDDEVLLDETSFVESAGVSRVRPSVAEQALLVLQCELHQLSRAKDEVTMEECQAMLTTALGSGGAVRSSCWAVVTDALLQRCQLGTKSSRRTEAALMQMEELSNQFDFSLPSAQPRLAWFFLARVPAIWQVQLQLARVLSAMGLTKSALDVLVNWDQWAAIIDCLVALGQRERAERIIRERIGAADGGETPELLCCLGDVTKERVHYERAWELSKRRSARAMRSLAIHFMFVDRDHGRACDSFEESLRINCLQPHVWFTYGVCCLRHEAYKKAVAAFKECVRLDPDNFEAWNNCASALVELGEKKSALALLKEAAKYNYENWRVWDNICIVSVAVGEFLTTIKGYHRVIDLKKQHRDPATLAVMVNTVATNAEVSTQIRPKLKELFARIASSDGRDPRIWMIYADLMSDDADQSDETKTRVLHCLSRSYHCMCESGWEHDTTQTKRVLTAAMRLVGRALEFDISYTSAKLAVISVKAILQKLRSEQVEELDQEVQQLLLKLDEADSLIRDAESRLKQVVPDIKNDDTQVTDDVNK